MGSKGSEAPPPPDYEKLMPLQAQADKEALQYSLDQMRVSQNSPYGSQTWERSNPTDGSAPQWTYNQTLSPEQQKLYDADISSKLQQSTLLGGAADKVQGAMAAPIDTSGLPSRGGALTAPTAQAGMSFGQSAPGYNPGSVQGPQAQQLGPGQLAGTSAVGSAGTGYDASRQNSVADTLYQQQMRFLQPEQDRASEDLRGKLIQSGFQEGSDAYATERNRLEQQQGLQRADARDRAILASGAEDTRRFGQDMASSQFGVGLAQAQDTNELARSGQGFTQGLQAADFTREGGQQNFMNTMAGLGFDRETAAQLWQQGLASNQLNFGQQQQAGVYNQQMRDAMLREQLLLRQQPLNELNALRTGAQINLPNNQAQYDSPQLNSQDIIGAADKTYQYGMDAYNAEQESSNSMLSGLMGMAGTAMGGPMGGMLGSALGGAMTSDRRLKEDIAEVGVTPGGAPLYTFRYRGQPTKFLGVMAQDLLAIQPEAVILQSDGYYAVDYGKVR